MFKIVVLRRKTAIAICLITALVLGIIVKANYLSPVFNINETIPTVVIDPGHGGRDKGASRGNLIEKDINLEIALELADFLVNNGVIISLTRDVDMSLCGDTLVKRHLSDLKNRSKLLNQGKMAISIHVNAGGSNKKGASIYYPKGCRDSKLLGELVLKELAQVQELEYDFVVPRNNLFILKHAQVPTILIEVGFISNMEDRKKLTDEVWKKKMGQAIGKGLLNFITNPLQDNN